MNKKDYFKYYIQGSDHYLLPKDIFDELFQEMINWKEESKQLKKQLDYLRSGKYLNQMKWERDFNEKMVEDLQEKIDSMTESYETEAEAKFYEYVDKHESKLQQKIDKAVSELFNLKDRIYKPENREENFKIQRKISSIIIGLKGEPNNE